MTRIKAPENGRCNWRNTCCFPREKAVVADTAYDDWHGNDSKPLNQADGRGIMARFPKTCSDPSSTSQTETESISLSNLSPMSVSPANNGECLEEKLWLRLYGRPELRCSSYITSVSKLIREKKWMFADIRERYLHHGGGLGDLRCPKARNLRLLRLGKNRIKGGARTISKVERFGDCTDRRPGRRDKPRQGGLRTKCSAAP